MNAQKKNFEKVFNLLQSVAIYCNQFYPKDAVYHYMAPMFSLTDKASNLLQRI